MSSHAIVLKLVYPLPILVSPFNYLPYCYSIISDFSIFVISVGLFGSFGES